MTTSMRDGMRRAVNQKAGLRTRLFVVFLALVAVPLFAQDDGSRPKGKKGREAAMTKLRDDLATVAAKDALKEGDKKKLEKVRETLRKQIEDLGYGKKVDASKMNGALDDVQKVMKNEAVSGEDKDLIQDDVRAVRSSLPAEKQQKEKGMKQNRNTNPNPFPGGRNRKNPF